MYTFFIQNSSNYFYKEVNLYLQLDVRKFLREFSTKLESKGKSGLNNFWYQNGRLPVIWFLSSGRFLGTKPDLGLWKINKPTRSFKTNRLIQEKGLDRGKVWISVFSNIQGTLHEYVNFYFLVYLTWSNELKDYFLYNNCECKWKVSYN